MLLVDGKEFNPSNPESFKVGQKTHPFLDVWEQADKAMKEVADRNKGKLKFILSQRHIHKDKFVDDPYQRPIKSNGVMVKTSEVYTSDKGSFEVTYYENSKPAKAGGERKYTPKFLDIPGDLPLDYVRDRTKIFYLLFISRWMAPVADEKVAAIQNQDRIKRPHFELDDRYTKYQEMANTDQKVGEVMGKIYSMTEKNLRDMIDAYRVSVPDKEHASMAEMQQALKSYVLRKQDGKYDMALINEFLNFTGDDKGSADMAIKANITKAFEQEVLVTKKEKTENKTVYFVYMGEERLFFFTPGKSKQDKAYQFFTENKDKYEEMKKNLQ